MKDAVITLHRDDGFRTGLVVREGSKFLHVIWPDAAGIKIRKVEKGAKFRVVENYPAKKAKARLRKCGKTFGITKSAKVALRG